MRYFLVLTSFLAFSSYAGAQDPVVVLANAIDGGMAQGLYSRLAESGVEAIKSDAVVFDVLKDSRFVVVLGGQKSPGGVGEIVSSILDEKQKESLLVDGAYGTFIREGLYSRGQRIYVFAGHEKGDTQKAWSAGLTAFLDGVSQATPRVNVSAYDPLIISPKSNTLSISFPVNVSETGGVGARGVEVDAYLNVGVRLEVEPAVFDLGPWESKRVLVKLNPKNVSSADVVTVRVGGSQARIRLNVTGIQKVPVCNVCAASDVK